MTMEFRTVSHRSSVLVVSLNSTLESFSFRNGSSVDLVASFKNVSFDLLCKCIISCVLEFELFYESLSSYSSFCEMSLLSLGYTMTMNDFLFTIFVFVYSFVFLVNESNLYSFVTVILYSLDLCYYTRTSLKYSYRCQCSVFIEDLSHSDFCS